VSDINRRAIIDIGSNSVRLVVYGGAPRAPIVLYNEKFAAGLGRGVLATGALDDANSEAALDVLARFAVLVKQMEITSLQVVATAAVRDAANGADFLLRVKALGLPAVLLGGDEEAITSGYGVIAAIPDADGIVVDLGGGSMELVRVSHGKVQDCISLPLGILRIAELTAKGPQKLRKYMQKCVADIPWLWNANDLPLYLVGGSYQQSSVAADRQSYHSA
jgi:exopolyphosphatase/guanosine-5'-triphosphate,3'-diphosphate pyrophosphatase